MNDAVPRWSLERIYSAPMSREFLDDVAAFRESVATAERSLDDHHAQDQEPAGWLRHFLPLYNRCLDVYEQLESYSYAGYSVDTTNTDAQNALTTVGSLTVLLSGLTVAFRTALARLGDLDSIIADDPELEGYRYILGEEIVFKNHQMSVDEERLATDLGRSGAEAWSRLHGTISSSLKARWQDDSEKTVVELRSLAFDGDRHVRRRAWELELEAWKHVETPLAFALNGVKGATVTVNSRRGWDSTLARSVRQNRLSETSLQTLLDEMESSLPLFRRYMRLKARSLGLEALSFYDLFAPVGTYSRSWTYEETMNFISKALGRLDGELPSFVRTVQEKQWIDAQPRAGKVGGAYSIDLPLTGESRILANFDGTYEGMSTLAHELGHAWHSYLVKDLPAMQRRYPMTLAETASIFNETYLFNCVLEETRDDDEAFHIIEQYLQNACQVVVDILCRYYFERSILEIRPDRELPAAEFCELMVDAQRRTYGDALREDELHPYMWAVKGHYYRADLAFYNFPYAFGQLFGLGLYDRFEENPETFSADYRALLQETGRKSAVSVAATVGCDIESPDFWRRSISRIEGVIDRFEALTERD